jgi:hypothetical protein
MIIVTDPVSRQSCFPDRISDSFPANEPVYR